VKIFDTRWKGAHGIGRFASELFERLGDFRPIELNGRPSAPLDPWRLSGYLWTRKPALFFSPGYNPPAGSGCPFGFTVHDLNHLYVEENSSALKRLYYSLVVRPAIHRAGVVLTVSEFSRQQICDWAGVSEDRVVNVSHGIADVFSVSGEVCRPGRPYFLYVGNHRPHKNLPRMLSAFAISDLSADFDLWITGDRNAELERQASVLKLDGSVKFLGQVSDKQLAVLYRGATTLLLVSLYEGFGLPIIEAMACGTPVLTSLVASMPEAAGGAALLVDPSNVEEIASKLRVLASDDALRSDLRHRGLRRVSAFTWDATAQRVQEALARCT
jgi:glycosyltransferase involved in cell wall biosynthesis